MRIRHLLAGFAAISLSSTALPQALARPSDDAGDFSAAALDRVDELETLAGFVLTEAQPNIAVRRVVKAHRVRSGGGGGSTGRKCTVRGP